ncbi:hypothetical protein PVK06_029774 [Gossypium arboreum]|uniref:Uncharacterized protein n=1 Tax=Gossypium arboreum TaxID=29729 RepID=A0ABR0NLI4_GOSAR|nr:hypothetical protein PVK06_029774 [Gossypium arboreum]
MNGSWGRNSFEFDKGIKMVGLNVNMREGSARLRWRWNWVVYLVGYKIESHCLGCSGEDGIIVKGRRLKERREISLFFGVVEELVHQAFKVRAISNTASLRFVVPCSLARGGARETGWERMKTWQKKSMDGACAGYLVMVLISRMLPVPIASSPS